MGDSQLMVIGGVTGGIGSALARKLLDKGHVVAGFARNVSKDCHCPEGVHFYEADSTDGDSLEVVFKKIKDEWGPVSGYAHCIGSIMLKAAHQLKEEEWRKTMEINLHSAFYASRRLIPDMAKNGGGNLVFVSSVAAGHGIPNHEAIAAAKAGLSGYVSALAATYVNKGIRANAVAPGLVDTPLAKAFLASEQMRQVSERMHPLGRVGSATEVASLMAWLLSDEASWVTGQTWSIDGGMGTLMQRPKV